MQTQIEIHTEHLNTQACIDWVMSPDSGGIDVFIGTVRNATKGKPVLKLEFEAYNQMAINEINKILKQAIEKWPVQKVLVHHRDAAFEACRYIIDTLKQTVPIWKKEFFEDGEVWVAAHP
jgi:molybdopterin synthase catalytic subunit